MAFDSPLAGEIWSSKYRFRPQDGPGDATVEATWDRVATALAEAEPAKSRGRWRALFREALEGYRFLPGGVLQGGHDVLLCCCHRALRPPAALTAAPAPSSAIHARSLGYGRLTIAR
jgi:hypothetical protein